MQSATASHLANEWLQKDAANQHHDANRIRVIVQRTLESLVPDGDASVVLLSGAESSPAFIGVVADRCLYRVRGDVNLGEPRGLLEVDPLSEGVRFLVTQEWAEGGMGEQFIERQWVVTLGEGRRFAFQTRGPFDAARLPFAAALTEACGWVLPG
jgi:hypothetical protein